MSGENLIEGVDYVVEGGLFVFTRGYLLRRGYCCDQGCRNCPYEKPQRETKGEAGSASPDPAAPQQGQRIERVAPADAAPPQGHEGGSKHGVEEEREDERRRQGRPARPPQP